MSLNTCSRCEKKFKFPYLLKNHKQRRFPCKTTLKQEIPEKVAQKLSKNYPKTIQPKMSNVKIVAVYLHTNVTIISIVHC